MSPSREARFERLRHLASVRPVPTSSSDSGTTGRDGFALTLSFRLCAGTGDRHRCATACLRPRPFLMKRFEVYEMALQMVGALRPAASSGRSTSPLGVALRGQGRRPAVRQREVSLSKRAEQDLNLDGGRGRLDFPPPLVLCLSNDP